MKKEFERLPRNVVPNFYHLDITPSFETFKEGMKLILRPSIGKGEQGKSYFISPSSTVKCKSM